MTASIAGSTVTIAPEAAGNATVTVTASDVGGSSATQAIVVTVQSGGPAGEASAVGMQLGPGDYVDLGTDWFAVTSDGLGCLSFICTRSALTLNGFEARPIAGTDNWQIHAVP